MIFTKGAIQALALLGLVGADPTRTSRSITSDGDCVDYVVGFHKVDASAESVASMTMSQDGISVKQVVNDNVAVVEIAEGGSDSLANLMDSLPPGATVDCDYPQFVPEPIEETDRRLTKDADSEGPTKKDSVRGRKLDEESPYGISMVQANQFGSVNRTRTKMTVCVVDTGYNNNHEDLPVLNASSDGFSPYGANEKWYEDGHGHGSHCAGTIGAIGDNDIGVTSCNPDQNEFSFYIGKGLTNSGSGSSSGVMQAVQACVDAGAKVVSMSLGGGGFSSTSSNDFKKHYDDNGVLFIAAAGNGGNSGKSYPASYTAVMSVAAVNSNEDKAGFSQYNDQVEIAGPGVGVKSTITGNNYASWSGTSMATPHVAGVAILVWSYFPECGPNQIRNVLLKTAKDRGVEGCDNEYGYGIVQAKAAYDLLDTVGCLAGGPDVGSNEAPGGCDQVSTSPTSSPVSSPVSPPTSSPVSSPTSSPILGESFVRITAFQATQKERTNGKLKTKLKFAIKDENRGKVAGAEVSARAYSFADDDLYEPIDKTYTCTTNLRGKCTIKLATYNPAFYSSINVTDVSVNSTLGEYNRDSNTEENDCPVFSSSCPIYEIEYGANN